MAIAPRTGWTRRSRRSLRTRLTFRTRRTGRTRPGDAAGARRSPAFRPEFLTASQMPVTWSTSVSIGSPPGVG